MIDCVLRQRAVPAQPVLNRIPLTALTIVDEDDYSRIPLYAKLRGVLVDANAHYLVAPPGALARWDQVLLLNLTFWKPDEQDDVLVDRMLTADALMHRAWHHVAHRALGEASTTRQGLAMGEAIASAFDLYLVGTLLRTRPGAEMLQTQVPAMADAAVEAGLSEEEFEALIAQVASDPTGSFESLRSLLFEVTYALSNCHDVEQAAAVLLRHAEHPLAPLLHHYELTNWTLYSRVYARAGNSKPVEDLHVALSSSDDSLAWLASHWLSP